MQVTSGRPSNTYPYYPKYLDSLPHLSLNLNKQLDCLRRCQNPFDGMADIADLGQETVWSWSTLFAQACLSEYLWVKYGLLKKPVTKAINPII